MVRVLPFDKYSPVTTSNELGSQELLEWMDNVAAVFGGPGGSPIDDLLDNDTAQVLAITDNANNIADNAADIVDLQNAIPQNLTFVESKSDFPAPVSGVITLPDAHGYFLTTEIDLTGDRIVCGVNSAIIGTYAESCGLISTGLVGTALITSAHSLMLRDVFITADVALDLDGIGNTMALDWTRVNFVGCATIGTIKDCDNFIGDIIGILSSANLTFDGTINTVAFTETIFVGIAGQTTVILPSSLTIDRRFRISNCAVVAFGGATAFDASLSATIPDEGYVFDTCNFSGGATYLAGIQPSDNRSRFIENRGVSNSASFSLYHMQGNATATTITATSTPVKIAGTTTSSIHTERFTNTDNRATYDGGIIREFDIEMSASATANTSPAASICIAVNGTPLTETKMRAKLNPSDAVNVSTFGIYELSETDYVEAWIENLDNTQNITVVDLVVRMEAIN